VKYSNETDCLESDSFHVTSRSISLLYLPQGFPNATIQLHKSAFQVEGGPASLFEPNQNGVMSGWLPPANEWATTYRSALAWNLVIVLFLLL
jgi:hypothetical protein